MAVEAVSVLLANVEAIGVIGAATVTFELWKQQLQGKECRQL